MKRLTEFFAVTLIVSAVITVIAVITNICVSAKDKGHLVELGRECVEAAIAAHDAPPGWYKERLWKRYNKLVRERNAENRRLGSPCEDFDEVNVDYIDWDEVESSGTAATDD